MTAKKEAPVGTLYAFWPYDQYPYFLCGEVTKMHESGAVETVGFGPGHRFMPVLIRPLNAGLRLREKLDVLREDYRAAHLAVEKDFKERLAAHVPELAETRRKR